MTHSFLALGITAAAAVEAPFLVDQQAAAVGALAGYVRSRTEVSRTAHHITASTAVAAGVGTDLLCQNTGDSIGARKHRFALVPGDGGAADAPEVFHYPGGVYAGPQSQRDQAATGFKLGRGAATGLAQGRKYFKKPVFI